MTVCKSNENIMYISANYIDNINIIIYNIYSS
nr:MAG TPA: hypothetical protein [Caudoviricetes sp.]